MDFFYFILKLFYQFFHKYLIPWIVGDLLDVQFFRLFEVLDILFPALLDILYQQLQVLGVERFSDIGVRSPQIAFCMVVLICFGSQEDNVVWLSSCRLPLRCRHV